jgi:hypothetical protein
MGFAGSDLADRLTANAEPLSYSGAGFGAAKDFGYNIGR